MSSQPSEELPPALPPRSSRRDSRESSSISPVQSPVQLSHSASAQMMKSLPAQPEHSTPPVQPAQPAQTHQQTQAQAINSLFPASTPAVPTETAKTKREELAAGDRNWQWKTGLRIVAIILGLIGIGCASWITAQFASDTDSMGHDFYYLDDAFTMPWTLITFVLSVVWCFICIAVFFSRHPTAPVHPGAQVGVDLILWLALIFTGGIAAVGTSSVADWGSTGRLSFWYSGSSDGQYKYAAGNDTWYWDSNQHSSYYGDDRACNATGSYQSRYSSTYRFPSCEAQDAYINALWHGKSTRYGVDLTATVCQFLLLVLHLTLFIWACVDTHRRRKGGVNKDAEKLAAEIVMNMVKNGAIIPAPGQAHFAPMPTQHFGPQQFPQQFAQPYPQQYHQQYAGHFAPQAAPQAMQQFAPPTGPGAQQHATVASSNNEKGKEPQYA